MGRLELGEWQERPHGLTAIGRAVAKNGREVPVTVRKPAKGAAKSGYTWVMAHGWLTGKHSMQLPAKRAVSEFGHTAITLGYTSTNAKAPLEQDAWDIATVLDAIPRGTKKAGLGHSMGAAALLWALEMTDAKTRELKLVAPAKFLLPRFHTALSVPSHMLAATTELTQWDAVCNPAAMWHLGAASVQTLIDRPEAVVGELYSLVSGQPAHDRLRRIAARRDAPEINLYYGDDDRLFPPHAMEHSIVGLPLSSVTRYEGGHCGLLYGDNVTDIVFGRDRVAASLSTMALSGLAA